VGGERIIDRITNAYFPLVVRFPGEETDRTYKFSGLSCEKLGQVRANVKSRAAIVLINDVILPSVRNSQMNWHEAQQMINGLMIGSVPAIQDWSLPEVQHAFLHMSLAQNHPEISYDDVDVLMRSPEYLSVSKIIIQVINYGAFEGEATYDPNPQTGMT